MGIIKSFGTRCYDGEIKLEGTHIKHPAPRRCSMPIPFTLLVFCSLGAYGLTKCLLMVPSEPACQCRRFKRRGFDPWVGKILWRKVRQPTSVFLPGGSQGQRSLGGYSPQGCIVLTQLKQLSLHARTHAGRRRAEQETEFRIILRTRTVFYSDSSA